MNRTVPGDEDHHVLPHRHTGSPAHAELSSRGDSLESQAGNESDGQADLPGRWNTQAPHLTALEALEQYGWSVFPLDREKARGRSYSTSSVSLLMYVQVQVATTSTSPIPGGL